MSSARRPSIQVEVDGRPFKSLADAAREMKFSYKLFAAAVARGQNFYHKHDVLVIRDEPSGDKDFIPSIGMAPGLYAYEGRKEKERRGGGLLSRVEVRS